MTNTTTPDQGDERRAMTAAYMAFCADKAPDHNEVGFPYFKAAWQARAAQPVAQPVVDQKTASVSDNGSCGSQVSDKPVAQEAIGTFNCPICGNGTPHHHSDFEQVQAMSEEQIDAELRALGIDPDKAAQKVKAVIDHCWAEYDRRLKNPLATPHHPASAEAGKGEPFGYWHEGPTEDESEFFLAKDLPSNDCPRCFPLYLAPSESVSVSAAPSALPAQAVGEKVTDEQIVATAREKQKRLAHWDYDDLVSFARAILALAAPVPQPEPASKAEVSVQEAENIIAALLRDTKDYGKPALVAKQWAEDFMRKRALASPTQQREPQEAAECPHVNEPCGCYRVRCQLGRKCVGDDL